MLRCYVLEYKAIVLRCQSAMLGMSITSRGQDMDITVTIKSVYGNELMYPVSTDAWLMCNLAGTKTITDHMVKVVEAAGYKVKLV